MRSQRASGLIERKLPRTEYETAMLSRKLRRKRQKLSWRAKDRSEAFSEKLYNEDR